ncbi:proline-rich protein 18 [Sphaerodactylus townsendi]|uniref:Uncharacterized protein n=1 Tax=Sphaerodactylus townsendi TaxID=933632 RepID=A0ACB8GB25_9SAUR|nr:proline-rich protein 18 [Sphaerodactylus townsendi]
MSLPPIAPPAAPAAPRSQPRKQQQSKAPAAAAASAPAKPPRKSGGVPSGSGGGFSSSWPSASLQKQLPRSRAAQASRNFASSHAAAAPGLPPSPAWGRSVWTLPSSGESLGAAQAGRGEKALRFSLSLPPEAIRVLQRRSLEKQRRQPVRNPGRASPDAAKHLLAAGSSAGGDWRTLLQVSLLNERHRYDDVEYEEETGDASGACKVDERLVRKCTEWLRGVESAAARDQGDRLDTLPHLSTL